MIFIKAFLSAAFILTGTLAAQEKLEKEDKENGIYTLPELEKKYWKEFPDSMKFPDDIFSYQDKEPGKVYRIPGLQPDDNIDYKIRKFYPDTTIDYKILKKNYKAEILKPKVK